MDYKRERVKEREKQRMCLYDEPESLADCASEHVPPCYHPAHFPEQSESKQAIKEMGQQE